MNKKQVRKRANRKLKEFGRWQRIARDDTLSYSDDYILQADGNDFHPVNCLTIDRETAQQELNAIKSAINGIDNKRLRQLLILNCLERRELKDVRQLIERQNRPFEPIKESQCYNLKNKALLAFAKQYRKGVLETLTD
ncbi:ArpU family transcriptional regulator [Streptococcus acidominimus]|uniref:ArpU family transcriptional regulator n=1 Tax=Streptococcus acidominimus TaxID=1326 RepID=A0A4Y9FPN2_STRAI|nr:ArpU family transcriptional regulator [Streptococcus acidominimus]MBF0818978.1 ArpU family transcriptional regulator [Streptococcus acidominimus]MBF0837903.1 ArpU family transcriptional regulator [Streptococcus acidominimus]MBF0846082.1 ArpU family transcriptional regulator [Streptococcus danieliae]TFU30490.1 ArpU family transcriptional regulator [Streptococcus acidominimus]